MKLILIWDEYNERDYLYFEYESPEKADADITAIVQKELDKVPRKVSTEDVLKDSPTRTILQGKKKFTLNGVEFDYVSFINLDPYPDTLSTAYWVPSVVHYRIISLDKWFDSQRTGNRWPNKIHSIIKKDLTLASVNINL